MSLSATPRRIRLRLQLVLAVCLCAVTSLPSASASGLATRGNDDNISASWYDWGYYGSFPRKNYKSFGAQSPRPALVQTDDRCDDGYIFVEPRGVYVETPGPVVMDNAGNLVWMQTQWGQAMDVKVQQYKGKDYITFWHGSDNGTFGEGYYLMVSRDVMRRTSHSLTGAQAR